VALDEYEAGLDENGIPFAESMNPLADPDNPAGTYRYVAKVARNFASEAVEREQKKPEWSGENYLRARKFMAMRVERTPARQSRSPQKDTSDTEAAL
jgi:hypothetical protein